MDTTLDGLLDRRLVLEQLKEGFRVAVDTVLLAAAVPARVGQSVADFGGGVGGALLCLAARVPGISATGIEIDAGLIALARTNIIRNKLDASLNVQEGDAMLWDGEGAFDHVMMNPPYHDEARHDVSAHSGKRRANSEKEGDLGRWIASAARALKPAGVLTLIHRADRREEIVGLLDPAFGRLEILPIMPKAGAGAKRIIIRARKGGGRVVIECRGFVLHKNDGYTDAAEAVLRYMKSIDFIAA